MNIPKSTATLQQLVDFYMESGAFCRLSSSSQRDYETHLQSICGTVVEGRKLGDYRNKNLKVRHLMQAYETWLDTGVRTANYRKSVLSAAWKNAMRYDVMQHDPVRLVQTVSSSPRRTLWSRDHIHTFLKTSYGDFRWRSIGLIVHMAYEWGQRVGDMRVLQWDKVDLDQCRLDLTQSKRNAEVHLPISVSLCNMLRQQKEDFSFQDYVVNDVLEEANLPTTLTAMDLRRTAVTEMMEGGVDIAGIMQVTGHKDIGSVKPYMVNTFSGASKALAARGNEDDEHS